MFNLSRSISKAGINIIFTGMTGSGKTTLLYSSLLGGFDESPKFEPTESFNFERIMYLKKVLLVWDTSGHIAFINNLLPVMLSIIKLRAIVYVVNLLQNDKLIFDEINNEIRSLLYNQQLSDCRFCIIFNTFGSGYDSWPKQPAEFASLLGLCYLPPQIDNRTKWFVVDTSKGFTDNGWRMAVEFILFGSIPNMPYYTNVPDFELTPVHYYYSQYDGKTPYGYGFKQLIPSDYISNPNLESVPPPVVTKPPKTSRFAKFFKKNKK
ncbi:ARF like small GTPase [Cryptosporidium ubiquitum]|uniref:ARF like small GTPase n=1 Tax=Cryptosporidium ubiquitum TaxID=857276 RepID=A0A1J4MME8_9CRYT|nr:ARF like small GTPase [Cryptosporidium ubiquitum]OII75442.1 ARF like small GTPase [Cryptosporidium ubiquitum]